MASARAPLKRLLYDKAAQFQASGFLSGAFFYGVFLRDFRFSLIEGTGFVSHTTAYGVVPVRGRGVISYFPPCTSLDLVGTRLSLRVC